MESKESNEETSSIEVEKPKTVIKTKRVIDLPVIERRNWLIHQHYIRNEFETCKNIIEEQLQETQGECEFALYVNAMILRYEGEINRSLELLQMCINLSPTNALIMKQIARNLFLLGKYKNAIECYNRSASMGGKDWEISHNMGVIHMQLKQYKQAEQSFNDALVLNKHDVTFITLSKLYIEINETEKAMTVLKNGVAFSPENIDMLTTLGLIYLKQQKFHNAFEYLGQALTFDPEHFSAILAAGSLMQSHGDYDVALAKYRVAAHKAPESASLWNNIAMCFFGKAKYVAAIACLKRAAYLAPFDWKIQYNLSLVHLTMQQPASAFKFASSALTLKPQSANLYVLLGVALNGLGEEENARKSYEEAIKLMPKNPHALINLAIHLNRNENTRSQAKEYILQLVKVLKDENNKEIYEIAKKLGLSLHMNEVFVSKQPDKEQKKKTKSTRSREPTKSVTEIPVPAPVPTKSNKSDRKSKSNKHTPRKESITNIVSGASEVLSKGLSQNYIGPQSAQVMSPQNLASLKAPAVLSPLKGRDALKQLPSVPTHELTSAPAEQKSNKTAVLS